MKQPTESGLFECEGKNFLFVVVDGVMYCAESFVESPRNESLDAGTQAYEELDDAGAFEE